MSAAGTYHRLQLLCHRFVVNHRLVHLRNELVELGWIAQANCPRVPQQVCTAVDNARGRNSHKLTVRRCEAYDNAAAREA